MGHNDDILFNSFSSHFCLLIKNTSNQKFSSFKKSK